MWNTFGWTETLNIAWVWVTSVRFHQNTQTRFKWLLWEKAAQKRQPLALPFCPVFEQSSQWTESLYNRPCLTRATQPCALGTPPLNVPGTLCLGSPLTPAGSVIFFRPSKEAETVLRRFVLVFAQVSRVWDISRQQSCDGAAGRVEEGSEDAEISSTSPVWNRSVACRCTF